MRVPLISSSLAYLLVSQSQHVLSVPAPSSPEGWEQAAFHPDNQRTLKPEGGTQGAVASEAKECSLIGKRLIAEGGNAVDAMVGTTFCVGVIAPYHSGIGGGGFALVRDAHGHFEAIDFRESAPELAHENMYKDNVQGSISGGLAVAVPSEVRGLGYMHQKYGSLSWEKVMSGAIDVARNGFFVSDDLVRYINRTVAKLPQNFILEDPNWAEDFAPNNKVVEVGDVMTRKRYANTLEKIAKEGPDAFYTGEIAQSMIDCIQDNNGIMTTDDIKLYQVISRDVITTDYKGHHLYSIPAPSGGPISLHILKVMEQWNDQDMSYRALMDFSKNRGTDMSYANITTHRYVEAMRFAYASRSRMGDPNFVEGMEELTNELVGDAKAKQEAEKTQDDRTLGVEDYNPNGYYAVDNHGTSHIVTADASGMAVSLTTTVNLLFGARLMDNKTGIILNNEMNDFSIPGVRNEFGFFPSESNFISPKKRPLSSIAPIIVTKGNPTDEKLYAVVGAAGGSRIISSTAQVLWRLMEFGVNLPDGLKERRLHDQLLPNTLLLEYDFDPGLVSALEKKGHNITYVPPELSAVQALRLIDGETPVFEAASEPRQANSLGVTV